MSVEHWQRLEIVYHDALALPLGERAAFVAAACAGNENLRREVEQLLAWDAHGGTFLDLPVLSPGRETSEFGSTEDPELAPDSSIGGFRVVRHLGRGGMGRVYEAEDLTLQRRVALKLLSEASSQRGTNRERVLREARAASALVHPHIVTVHAVGQADGRDFIVMEYVDGETLRQILARGPLPLRRTLALAASIADALATAHARGVVHRDIKPDNVMVTSVGEPKLLDFGVAHHDLPSAFDSTPVAVVAYSGRAWGTVGYMSPEQVSDGAVDYRSDQFAFGVVLYELLAGFRPFDRDSAAETLTAIVQAEPRPLTSLGIDCPLPLQWAIERCLAKDPADRFGTTSQLRDELAAIRDGLTVGTTGAVEPRLTKPPVARTSLIGRARDLQEVTHLLLNEDARLITLTGPGGVGKTRLAAQIATALDDRFEGLVGFVDLSTTTDAKSVAAVIVQALDVRDTGGRPMREVVCRWMRDHRGLSMLLVIDNFEHVLDAAPLLTSLVDANQALRIIVTSRAVLRVQGEREYPVRPLMLPVPGAAVETLAGYAAVMLFVQRAVAARADFALTADNAEDVASICTKLDGLPMAIELAAARVKSLSPTEILSRLRSRLQLLTGGGRDLPARRQTVRNAIDWSYELLDRDEQRVFCKMSVFVGGATLEALEAACNPFEDLTATIVDVVGSLIDKSMVVRVDAVQGETRFTMLETLREYALVRLGESGEEEITRRAHAAYCLVLAEEWARLHSDEQIEIWRERCDVEVDNLRVAMEWLVQTGQVDWGLRLSIASELYWFARGWPEWLPDLRARLFQLPSSPSSPDLWRAVGAPEGGALSLGSPEESPAEGRTTLQQAGQSADPAMQATVLIGLGARALYNEAFTNARGYLSEALEISRRIGNDTLSAGALSNLATLEKLEGHFREARGLYVRSRELFERIADKGAVAWSYNFEADAARQDGDLGGAEALLDTALQYFQELKDAWGIGSCLNDLGSVASGRLDFALADARYRGGLRMFQAVRHRGGIRKVLEGLAITAVARQERSRALRLAGAAAALWGAYRDDFGHRRGGSPELERALARVRVDEGPPAAAAWLEGWNRPLDETIAYALGDPITPKAVKRQTVEKDPG